MMYDEPALVFSKDEVKTEVSKQFSLFLVITAPRARARARRFAVGYVYYSHVRLGVVSMRSPPNARETPPFDVPRV
jgi:hypothetical protein